MSTTYYKDNKEYSYREAKNIVGANFSDSNKNIEAILRDGFVVVMPTPKPTPTTNLKQVLRDGVIVDALGNTVQAWKEVDMFTSALVEDGVIIKTIAEQEADYLAKLAEDATKAKIQEGETYIKTTVNGVVDAFNTKYGVKFDSIYNMAIYKDDINYPLYTQCDTLIKWQNSMWSTARANQASVLAGTMTDAEFLALLPVAPIV